MIGVWLKFDEDSMPGDGEAIAWLDFGDGVPSSFAGHAQHIHAAIHVCGELLHSSGGKTLIPLGALWTSLPPLPIHETEGGAWRRTVTHRSSAISILEGHDD